MCGRQTERTVNTLVQLTLSPSWKGNRNGNEDGHRMGMRLGMGKFLRI